MAKLATRFTAAGRCRSAIDGGDRSPRQWAHVPGSNVAERLAALPPNHSPGFAPHLPTALPAATSTMTVAALIQLSPSCKPSPP